MDELTLYTKALKVVDSCKDYQQLISAIQYIDLLEKNKIKNKTYIKELRDLIKSRGNILTADYLTFNPEGI